MEDIKAEGSTNQKNRLYFIDGWYRIRLHLEKVHLKIQLTAYLHIYVHKFTEHPA